MEIDPSQLSARERYQLLISTVIPRPIAWLSTRAADGIPNLAPFSFFGGITASPPTVMVSIGRRRGQHKDSAANLLATGEGVVHIAHRPLAEAMVRTSAEVPAHVNEFDLAQLDTAASVHVAALRIQDAAIAMEVKVEQHLEVGDGPSDLFLLEIIHYHLRDDFLDGNVPDPRKLNAIGRLGGNCYCNSADVFEVERPR